MRCLCAVATLGSVASYVATYALLRRWERLRVGERSSGARPLGRFACKEWRRLLPCLLCANVGGHAS
ncbi:MAG: hypothetical protein IIZ97_06470 [Prevotella sp.]|nr:hypothetical protein [Prevotella sp.]